MGIQETAQDVLGLVQALAQGKQVEYRERKHGALWHPLKTANGELGFALGVYEYRIKTDPLEEWRKELLDHVLEYGKQTEKATECYVRNNQREGANYEAFATNALTLFKTKLVSGPGGFR